MIRVLENQERINPPEGADRVSRIKRRSETESRDFSLNMNEAVQEKEKREKQENNNGDETTPQDSVELSSAQEESDTEITEETLKAKLDKIDIKI
jgi:hypothetical protein